MTPLRRGLRAAIRAPERWLARFETTLPVDDARSVVRVGDEDAQGLDLAPVWDECVRLYEAGLHPAVGLTVFHRGRCVLDRTVGHVTHTPGQPPGEVVTPETPFNLFSASKILTAMLVHAVAEDGAIDLNQRVAHYLPAFAAHGKDNVRLRHLLNHTAGIPDMPRDIDPMAILQSGEIPWDAVFALEPKSAPGRVIAYHPVTSWVILQRILEEATGRPLQALMRERLTGPAGLSGLTYGVAADRVADVAKHAYTGVPAPKLMSEIFERTIGLDLDAAVGLTNTPEFLTAVLPSANICGTGREVCAFLQLLLDQGRAADGTQVLSPATVRGAVTDVTPVQLDGTFGFPMRYGLGMMMGGMRFSLFGLNTRGAFGHLGFTGVVVYADPVRELAVAFLNTGKPMLAPGMVRWYWILQKLALAVPRPGVPWHGALPSR